MGTFTNEGTDEGGVALAEAPTGLLAAAFRSPLGWIELAWSPQGLVALRFASDERGAALADLDVSWGAESPEWVDVLAEQICAHLAGRPQRFSPPLDLSRATPFQREVYRVCAQVPPGQVVTYGTLAARMGRTPGSARAIGGAMARNPVLIVVPCHRVVGNDGRLTGFSATGGLTTKQRMLQLEGTWPLPRPKGKSGRHTTLPRTR